MENIFDIDLDQLPVEQIKTDQDLALALSYVEADQSLVVEGLDINVYHNSKAYGSTQLKLIAKSPALFHWSKNCPFIKDELPTDKIKKCNAAEMGNAFHCAVLEPQRFLSDYVQEQKINRVPKEGKIAYAEMLEKNKDKIIIEHSQFNDIINMRDSVLSHPSANIILNNPTAKKEVSIFWKCPDTGIIFKIRCDCMAVIKDTHYILDLKSTSADMSRLQKAIWDYGYDMQSHFYSYIYERAFKTWPVFAFAFTSKTAPLSRHETIVGIMNEAQKERGETLFNTALHNIINYSDKKLYLEEF